MPDGGIRHRLRRNPDARRAPVAVRCLAGLLNGGAGARVHTPWRDDQASFVRGTNAKVGSHTVMSNSHVGRRQVDNAILRYASRSKKEEFAIWPYFQLSFIDAQTQCQIRRYPYAGAESRYLLAGCKSSGAKYVPEAVRLSRKIVFFVPRMT